MSLLIALLALVNAAPSSIDCIDAHRVGNEAAIRIGILLNREVERGSLNRAEIGAMRSAMRRRERLLACSPATEL